MRIGILTFHSQLNYGGVLQCWALQTALEKMGHEVVVIDRIFGQPIRSYWNSFAKVGRRGLIAFLPRLLVKDPRAYRVLRAFRTIKFFKGYIKLSRFSFSRWSEIRNRHLGLDCMIVGSDQVWNCTWQDPGPYLLEGAPNIPAIAYGASLGMTSIPDDYVLRFREAEQRFMAISVREEEAMSLLLKIGIKSKHVLDPVFLCNKAVWEGLAWQNVEQCVVCYFIDQSYQCDDTLRRCEALSEEYKVPVYVFVNQATNWRCTSNRVRYCFAAGPVEFLSAIKASKCIITDSFHALALGIIFGKHVIVDKPRSAERVAMFSRIRELQQIGSELPSSHILEDKIEASMAWLTSSLAICQSFHNKKVCCL